MARSLRLPLVLVAALAAQACTYPDFGWRPDKKTSTSTATGTGGAAGAGGASTSSSSSTSSSTTSSTSSSSSTSSAGGGGSGGQGGMPPVPEVPCEDPMVACSPGEACCFDTSIIPTDFCSASCPQNGYFTLSCNGAEDCPVGTKCCAGWSGGFPTSSSSCKASCSQAELCDPAGAAKCSGGSCMQTSYPGWGVCQ